MIKLSLPARINESACRSERRGRSSIIPIDGVEQTNDSDVLLGRGKRNHNHPGNAAFRDIVTHNKVRYATSIKSDKHKLSTSIVHAIYRQGGRFLKQDNKSKMWIDIGEKKAVEKTSQALREQQSDIREQLEKQGVSVDFSKTFLQRQDPFRATSMDIVDETNPIADQSPPLVRASTIDGCMLQRQAGFRVDSLSYGASPLLTSTDDKILEEPTLVRASTEDISSIRMNVDDDPLLGHSSLPSSPAVGDGDGDGDAVLAVSKQIFEENCIPSSFQDDSNVGISSFIDGDEDDKYDIETSSACESSRKLSLLGRMSGLTEDLAMSQKSLMLKRVSKLSDASNDYGGFRSMRFNDSLASIDDSMPTVQSVRLSGFSTASSLFGISDSSGFASMIFNDSISSNADDSMPAVQSVPSTRSMFSRMSGFSTSSFGVSDANVDELVSGLVKKVSLDVDKNEHHTNDQGQ